MFSVTFLFILILSFCLTLSLNVKIFIPNTNYGNHFNWKEQRIPCEQSHIVFPNKSPKVFINGTSIIYHISDMVLPINGELILDDMASITTIDSSQDSNCDVIMSHYERVGPDFWYNPMNWCQALYTTSPCEKKPQIEASLVPSAMDTAVFQHGNTFHVGLKSSERKITVRQILLRDKMYQKTFQFRQKIKRQMKSNVIEFENIDNKYPPIIELIGNKYNGDIKSTNSNLKRMKDICSYVQCTPTRCQRPIKPSGSCCQLCGEKFAVKMLTYSNVRIFETWFDGHMDTYYKTKLIFNVLPVGPSKVEVVISSLNDNSDIPSWLATELVDKIMSVKHVIGLDSVEELSWVLTVGETKSYAGALIKTVIILSIIIVVAILIGCRRRLPSLPVSTISHIHINMPHIPTIKWPTFNINFFREAIPRTRLKEEVDTSTIPGSMYPSMTGAEEAIELPEKVTDVSFDNPIYDSENIEDSRQ